MEIEYILPVLAPIALFGGLFCCSLFACKTWISRVLFTIVMPVVYGLVGFLCLVVFGCFAMLMPEGIAAPFSELAVWLSVFVSLVLFGIQVRAMSRDNASAATYHTKFGGRMGRGKKTSLPHVVTQRRYMRE